MNRPFVLALMIAVPIDATGASEAVQIVLDDMELKSESSIVGASEGSYRPCMEDAYKGQFHHDWAMNKGSVSYTFKVNVPVSGCYQLEEYHPGKQYACSQYLPRNAKLDVKLKDKGKTITINQAVNGGQWNDCNCEFQFDQGAEVELTMRNHAGEQCDTHDCFWVVDAFRLTRKGDACAELEAEPRNLSTSVPNTLASNTPASTSTPASISMFELANTPEMSTSTGREGTLLLEATWSGVGSVQLKLKEHKDILETVLAAHLGRKSVQVLGIWAEGRRLLGSEGSVATEHLKIKFAASDATIGSSSKTDLRQALSEAFDQKVTGITFVSAAASWGWTPMPQESSTNSCEKNRSHIVMYIVVGAVGAICLLGLGLLMRRRRTKRNAEDCLPSQKSVMPKEEVPDLESHSVEDKDFVEKKIDNVETISASTDTPGSGDEHSEGSGSVQLANGLQQEPEVVVTGHVVEM